MSNLTVSVYMDWGHPLRIFTGAVEQEKESLDVPFFVSVRDFSENVGSSTIKRWGSGSMPCPGSIKIQNNILTNKQEPHYHCTAVPFVEIRKLTNNTDMHPRNKERANAIIKWLEPIYKKYAETTLKPIETGTHALSSKFSDITVPDSDIHEQERSENSSIQGCAPLKPIETGTEALTPQIRSEYRKLRESGMSAPEALTAVLGEPQRPRTTCEPIVQVGFTVDDVAKRLYELKKENEDLKAEVEKLKKELKDYRAIRDMFLSIGG